MSTERSNGKPATRHVRSSALRAVEAVDPNASPSAGRSEGGRFATGNKIGSRGQGKSAHAGLLMAPGAKPLFRSTMAVMASQATPVRSTVALHVVALVMSASYSSEAQKVGLASAEGQRLATLAEKFSARAERLLISAHDLARIAAETERKNRPEPWRQWVPPPPMPEDDEDEDEPNEGDGDERDDK